MFVVDTNVLLYAANTFSGEHAVCRALLERWRQEPTPWYLTWGIVYEFLRVATHPRIFPTPLGAEEAVSFLDAVLAAPSATVMGHTPRHGDLLHEVVETTPELRGNLFRDAHIVALMREQGVSRIVTRDTDFHRFVGVEVIDPLTLEDR